MNILFKNMYNYFEGKTTNYFNANQFYFNDFLFAFWQFELKNGTKFATTFTLFKILTKKLSSNLDPGLLPCCDFEVLVIQPFSKNFGHPSCDTLI